MKRFLLRFRIPLALVLSFAVGTLLIFLMSLLFSAWNLSAETVSRAPAATQALYAGADDLLRTAYLLPACLLLCAPVKKSALSRRQLWSFPMGAALCAVLISVLLIMGSVRISRSGVRGSFLEILLSESAAILCFVFTALLFRKHAGAFKNRYLRLVISALGEAIVLSLCLSPCLGAAVNGLLLGCILFYVYGKQKSILPEILFLTAFRLTESVVFAYPDKGGVYPVSENLLTGQSMGLLASGVLTIGLIITLIFGICVYRNRKRAA